MRTISLWQPWATLIAVGAKRIETRHWPAPARLHGQRIAIHAAKTRDHLAIATTAPFADYIPHPVAELPLGAVVATAVLDRCTEITERGARELAARLPDEYAFGLYEPGRFAWVLRDVIAVDPPAPFRGSQGFFDVPDDLLGVAVAQQALALGGTA
jgi:hypothetical protein